MNRNPGAYVGVASKSGRTGIALPLNGFLGIASLATALIIIALSLILWPIMMFWHELCWASMILIIMFWTRKIVRAYREGKS